MAKAARCGFFRGRDIISYKNMSTAEVEAFGQGIGQVESLFDATDGKIELAETGWRSVSISRSTDGNGIVYGLTVWAIKQPIIHLTRYLTSEHGEHRGIMLCGLPAAFAAGETVTGLYRLMYVDEGKSSLSKNSEPFFGNVPHQFINDHLSQQGVPIITADYLTRVPPRINAYKTFEGLRDMISYYVKTQTIDLMPLECANFLVPAK